MPSGRGHTVTHLWQLKQHQPVCKRFSLRPCPEIPNSATAPPAQQRKRRVSSTDPESSRSIGRFVLVTRRSEWTLRISAFTSRMVAKNSYHNGGGSCLPCLFRSRCCESCTRYIPVMSRLILITFRARVNSGQTAMSIQESGHH